MRALNALREVRLGLSHFSLRDRAVTESQMRRRVFQSELVMGVAARCAWGAPQVLLCRPLHRGRPFPTLFWLTCPHLSYLCGTLESRGGVHSLEEYLGTREAEYRDYNSAYALARIAMLSEPERKFLRRYNPKMWNVMRSTGIGGIRMTHQISVKCLHLQTAACLGLAGHPAKPWLKERFGEFCCKEGRCLSPRF